MYYNIHCHQQDINPLHFTLNSLYEEVEQAEERECSLGIHPWYPEKLSLKNLQNGATHPNVKAIGECGLDKLANTDWALQESLFEQQILLANELQKPLIIHCVRAYPETLKILQKAKVPAIFHGFNKNQHIAEQIIRAGHYLSFGKHLTYNDNESLQAAFKQIPKEKIFFETDTETPEMIEAIYQTAAQILNCSLNELIVDIEKNFKAIFAA